MASLGVWIQAARPRTLPASVAPVAVGTVLAAGRHPQWLPALGCLGGALLIQIGCNFANDAFDALKGADTAERAGPRRAVAAGLISPRAMLAATALVLTVAFAIGLYLTAIAGPPILALGVVSIACAIAYTGGPFPLAYRGLGDVFVFLFFGLAAVMGTWWVQQAAGQGLGFGLPAPRAHEPGGVVAYAVSVRRMGSPWLIAAALGLQCTAIIAVNNLRDIATDAPVGKRTLAVRLGDRASRWYYLALHLGATALYATYAIACGWPTLAWAPALLALVGGLLLSRGVFHARGAELNRYLARSAALEMLTGALFVLAYTI